MNNEMCRLGLLVSKTSVVLFKSLTDSEEIKSVLEFKPKSVIASCLALMWIACFQSSSALTAVL